MVEYRNKPENIYNWDNNHVIINYNIVGDKDKNGIFYKCDQVVVEVPLTYEKLVESLIRTKYTISDELALLRQKETKLLYEQYQERMRFCQHLRYTIEQLEKRENYISNSLVKPIGWSSKM